MRKNYVYPSEWASGPDDNRHTMYYQWMTHRKLSIKRGDAYNLGFEDWVDLMSPPDDPARFTRYGKKSGYVAVYRIDKSEPWHRHNIMAVTPEEYGIWRKFQNASRKYYLLQSQLAEVLWHSSLQER